MLVKVTRVPGTRAPSDIPEKFPRWVCGSVTGITITSCNLVNPTSEAERLFLGMSGVIRSISLMYYSNGPWLPINS